VTTIKGGKPRGENFEENRERFLTWLLTPKQEREPPTQTALALELGLNSAVLSNWKREPEFLEQWNTQYLRTISSPETKMSIIDALRSIATDADDPKIVQAAKAYFEIEGSLRPAKQQVDVQVTARSVSELSDADLQRLLSAKADDELAKRRDAS
jgi:hypothetical protein